MRRLGERGAVQLGLAANAAGLALLAGVHGWAPLVPALLLLTVGQGLITPTLASMVAGRVGERRFGQGLGVQQAVGGLARVLGPDRGRRAVPARRGVRALRRRRGRGASVALGRARRSARRREQDLDGAARLNQVVERRLGRVERAHVGHDDAGVDRADATASTDSANSSSV